MNSFAMCWRCTGGIVLAACLLADVSRAYVSPDNRMPSPTYQSTNPNPVTYSTVGGQYRIDSFFDVFVDLQRVPPPGNGTQITSFFDVFVDIAVAPPGGASGHATTNTQMTLRLNGLPPGTPYPFGVFDTEMLQMNLAGGSFPPGFMLRESPTLQSTGKTTIGDAGPGLYQIDSFFDVFTELSIDGGQTWNPASGPLHLSGGLPEPSSAVLALMAFAAAGKFVGRQRKR